MQGMIFTVIIAVMVFFASPALAAKGMAKIQGTTADSQITGSATLTEVDDGLQIEVTVANVAPSGKHGFHVHQFGRCEDSGKAAGGHYNPDNVLHGYLPKDGHTAAHAGDMGNIDIAEDGTGTFNGLLPGITLSGGKYNVAGRAVILHAKEDDFGQPTGNAGGRIACGVIPEKA